MRFEMLYHGQNAGWVTADTDARGTLFHAEATVKTTAVLRLYGVCDAGEPLRIGVLEPVGDTLRLNRKLTGQTLRTAGFEEPPTVYYLDDGTPGCAPVRGEVTIKQPALPEAMFSPVSAPKAAAIPPVDDPLLHKVVQAGAASVRCEDDLKVVRAPFAPGRAHPLHFALTACAIEDAGEGFTAVLRQGEACD